MHTAYWHQLSCTLFYNYKLKPQQVEWDYIRSRLRAAELSETESIGSIHTVYIYNLQACLINTLLRSIQLTYRLQGRDLEPDRAVSRSGHTERRVVRRAMR